VVLNNTDVVGLTYRQVLRCIYSTENSGFTDRRKEILPLIRMATRFPLLTVLAIVIGGFFIFAIIFVATRLVTNPDHVVVTSYEVGGENDNGKVAVTINRISHHPATKVRGIYSRQADSTARPEYIQVDGTIALSTESSRATALIGPAIVEGESGERVEREIRTRGNSCISSGWPTMALQIKARPVDFSIRIPLRDDPVAATILDSIKDGKMPPITIKGIYLTDHECESLEVIQASTPQEISLEPISKGPGVRLDFYPYGEPRFDESADKKRQLWREWARGWVPGEF
jgi:hypothetical protein